MIHSLPHPIDWPMIFLFGLIATILLTTILTTCQGLNLTRMDIPYMLGTIFTSDRDKAKWMGFIFHVINGWVFALIYSLTLILSGFNNIFYGMMLGLFHGCSILTVGMGVLPSLHPRMADEQHGPDPTRQLEPPGFLALNYGRRTPLVTLAAHLLFGAVLGFFT
jgi:hypothetical protein